MALVTCPECGRERVSDTALACPECGFNIREYYEKQKGVSAETKKNRYKALLEQVTPESIGGAVKDALNVQVIEKLTERAVSQLAKGQQGRVLLSGSGRGAALEALIRRTSCPIDVIDISETALKKAEKWNLTYVRGGRLKLTLSSLGDYEAEKELYSAAIAVNPGSFEETEIAAEKLAELLPAGGLLVLAISKNALSGGKTCAPEEIQAALEKAGFTPDKKKGCPEGTLLTMKRG